MTSFRNLVTTIMATVGLFVLGTTGALADGVQVARITGRSPYPSNCPAFYPFPDAEVEFTLAADARHPSSLTAAWIQGALGSTMTSFSNDGGRRFMPVIVPALQSCTGGPFDASVDPTLSAGPRGPLYLATLPASSGHESSTVWVSRSFDRGRSWRRPVFVDHRADESQEDDRPAVTADPFRARRAYVVWSEAATRPTAGGTTSSSPEVFFSRTTDSGARWSRPRALAAEPPSSGAVNARVLVTGRDRLVCVYAVADVYNGTFAMRFGAATRFMAIRSHDAGRTWTRPRLLGVAPTLQPKDPERSDKIVRAVAAENFGAAADRRGHVYVLWTEIRRASALLRLVRSRDGGRSWGRPRNITGRAVEPLLPNLAVSPNGTVGITFYDWRADKRGDAPLTTEVWFRRSRDYGRHWREHRIGGPFDLRTAPYFPPGLFLSGYFLGEYQGLVGLRRGFVATFAQAKPKAVDGMLDGFAARIAVRP